MPSHPKISILLPIFNADQFLPSCLESLLKQTYPYFEIIAIDDCSKDKSLKILNFYRKHDKRIKILRNKKRYGIAICYNRALKIAKGEFIAFMNPFETSSVHRLKKQLNFLLQNNRTAVVGVQTTYIENKKIIGHSFFPTDHEEICQQLLSGTGMEFSTMMINRLILPKDLLTFTNASYPFVYTEQLLKIIPYGKFANLEQYLQSHYITNGKLYKQMKYAQEYFSLIKLSLKSITIPEYRLSLKNFFLPILSPLRTIFH